MYRHVAGSHEGDQNKRIDRGKIQFQSWPEMHPLEFPKNECPSSLHQRNLLARHVHRFYMNLGVSHSLLSK
ncbi:unnamed protein product [Lathyrus oleraceus]